ncbi:MAG: LamG domain-containing protein [Nitrospirae bacterium]|nr:LamG domain-containing protein [Nitrospirota bacterium]
MKKFMTAIIFILMVISLTGCSSGGSGSSGGKSNVTVTVGKKSLAAINREAGKALFAKAADFFKFLLPDEAVAASSSIPSNVKTITFTIQGPDMTTLTREVDTSGRMEMVESFDVPNGPGRIFTVEAKNSCGSIIYKGTTFADINGAESVTVVLADNINKFYYDITGLISSSTGTYSTSRAFGSGSSSNVSANGLITINGESSITLNVPCEFRGGSVMELQVNYVNAGSSRFTIIDDKDNEIANSALNGDDKDHNTYTWQVPVQDTETLTILAGSNVNLNAYLSFLPIETKGNSGVYVADIRQGSSRINTELTTDTVTEWGGGTNCISVPANFWGSDSEEGTCIEGGNDLVFNVSDVVSGMTEPVMEINFGREEDRGTTISLYDDEGVLVGSYFSDSEDDEEMGQTFIVNVTDYKNSSYFRINSDCDSFINPFVKLYDAASVSGKAVLLDVQVEGSYYESHTGEIDFYRTSDDYPGYVFGYNEDSDLEYRAPHWMALGEGSGTLVFSVPEAVRNFSNPVLEIVHFAPESDMTDMEFYLLDESDNEIAHIQFNQMNCDFGDGCGGVLKNQIPLGSYKNSSLLKLRVPGGSIAAFPGFIKIFDAESGSTFPREGHILDANTVALWRLDEVSASFDAADETGSYNLTQFGSPDIISGQIGNGRLLDGNSRFFQRLGDANLGTVFNGDWTYEGWVYLDPSFSANSILFIYNGLAFSFNQPDTILAEVGVNSSRKVNWQQWHTTSTYTEGLSNTTLQTGQFYHIAVSRTAQGGNLFTYRLYVNGAIDTTTTDVAGLSYAVSGASHYIGLGCYTDIAGFRVGSAVFNGLLDDTRISNVARSDAEILQSYQRGM